MTDRDCGPDPVIARLAAAQHGVVSRAQLRAAGVGRGAIALRLSEQRLHPVHRGVYLVGHVVGPPLARYMAAVLACGPGAVISHASAAVLWRIRPGRDSLGPIDVTMRSGGRRVHPGIHVHRHRTLGPNDARCVHGIPLTAPGRTIVDLAAMLPARELERAVDEARHRRPRSACSR